MKKTSEKTPPVNDNTHSDSQATAGLPAPQNLVPKISEEGNNSWLKPNKVESLSYSQRQLTPVPADVGMASQMAQVTNYYEARIAEQNAAIAELNEKINKLETENKLLQEQNSELKANIMVESFVWLLCNIMYFLYPNRIALGSKSTYASPTTTWTPTCAINFATYNTKW